MVAVEAGEAAAVGEVVVVLAAAEVSAAVVDLVEVLEEAATLVAEARAAVGKKLGG